MIRGHDDGTVLQGELVHPFLPAGGEEAVRHGKEAAMKMVDQWVASGLKVFGNENGSFDGMGGDGFESWGSLDGWAMVRLGIRTSPRESCTSQRQTPASSERDPLYGSAVSANEVSITSRSSAYDL